MLEDSIRTVLIPAWQQARRSGNRGGSVACLGKTRLSGTIRSKLSGRASHIWLGCIPEDEIQWGTMPGQCHTMVKVALRDMQEIVSGVSCNQLSRHAFSQKVNGIKSRPKYDSTLHKVNMGSPLLVNPLQCGHLCGDGTPILPNGLPVMGVAVGPYVKYETKSEDDISYQQWCAKIIVLRGSGVVHVSSQLSRKVDC